MLEIPRGHALDSCRGYLDTFLSLFNVKKLSLATIGVMRSGVVWCGVMWCDVVWVVWCGVVWCGVE